MSRAKTREMVEGPAAFENFRRLMARLLAVPKEEVAEAKMPRAKRRGSAKMKPKSDL
ncbi:hypothetical protein SBA4_3090019 [Candidatus Sulfopaludibacter sp. SbA4]|nr:hypothetical protein SBA4_3090019 [Candidatus Sulfopaludibacter sp. SbA4]